MKFDNTSLPDKLKKYMEEITDDNELLDAFYDCDVEIYDENWVKDLEDDDNWLEVLMGPGISSYSDMKPFARDGSGALWVVINDEMIGYIGTEGECGIVAKCIDDFMNIIAFGKYVSDYCDVSILKTEKDFLDSMDETEQSEHEEVFGRFAQEHGFTKERSELYRMLINGLTVEPFLEVKAVNDEYCDSYSLLGSDDGQESLLELINAINY